MDKIRENVHFEMNTLLSQNLSQAPCKQPFAIESCWFNVDLLVCLLCTHTSL